MNNNFDLVVIYRRMEKKDVINYIPVYCEVGTYKRVKYLLLLKGRNIII